MVRGQRGIRFGKIRFICKVKKCLRQENWNTEEDRSTFLLTFINTFILCSIVLQIKQQMYQDLDSNCIQLSLSKHMCFQFKLDLSDKNT